MSADLIDPLVLFEEPEHGACCDCCEGFCPLWEDPHGDGFDVLVSMTVRGVEYLGTNACLVRRDILADLPEKVAERVMATKITNPPWGTSPTERPPTDVRPQSARILDRLDRAGITRHHGEEVVHLYIGEQHVGWCMWNKSIAGCVDADLPLVRIIAKECGITLPAAQVALHLARGGEVA